MNSRRLLLGTECPVLESHLATVAFATAQGRYWILAAAPEADLEI